MLFGFSIFVRNEMKSLPELMDLVIPYVEEVVVFDTGDSDGTWNYLRDLERKQFDQRCKVRPYKLNIPFDADHFNFGHARSIAAHLNKCEYVLMLDADERMAPKDLMTIRDTLVPNMKANDWYSATFRRHNWYTSPGETPGSYDEKSYPDWQTRLIKNDGTVWWRRPVHEACLYGPEGKQINSVQVDMHIEHWHTHFRKLKNDDGSWNYVYIDMAESDPEWKDTYPPNMRRPKSDRLADIMKVYREELSRDADLGGMHAWAATDKTIEQIRQAIRLSAEYIEKHR